MTADLRKALEPCPFCKGAMQFRKALWPSDGNVDAIIHAGPTACGMVAFEDGSTDESIIGKWNERSRPVTAGRDEIARIIDPLIFELWSGSGGHHYQRDWDKALAKADAILALGPAVSPQDGGAALPSRETLAKAMHRRRYQMDAKDTDSMFAWYAENPEGTDRSRMAIYQALRDADAVLAVLAGPPLPRAEGGVE